MGHVSLGAALGIATVVAAVVVVAWVLVLSVRYTLAPGETDAGHIKRRVLEDERADDSP